MISYTAVLVCFCLAIHSVAGLTCKPCEGVSCPAVSTYDCPLGVVEKGCGCCHECAKDAGERCGGSFDIFGKCTEGLTCVGAYLWTKPGTCKTPEEVERDRTSTTSAPGPGLSTTTRPPWLQG